MSSVATPKSEHNPWLRETIDSFGVALILAFLFRAFVAEAFVIPTGSMAPTLMGAHKDLTCTKCGYQYQASASDEFNSEQGTLSGAVIFQTTCPICRYQQPVEVTKDANQKTFSGDRILVSKLAYIQSNPERWQVFVFKNPVEARQNYIKRLVGLQNETIHIEHGNIYVKSKESQAFSIARKPPRIVEELLQPVNDTQHRPPEIVKAGVPSPWQPVGALPGQSSDDDQADAKRWQVTNSEDAWSAVYESAEASNVDATDPLKRDWLRYYHYSLKPWEWFEILQSGQLSTPIAPRTCQLITDFAHYNAIAIASRDAMYNGKNAKEVDYKRTPFGLQIQGETALRDSSIGTDGVHWVGDLGCEFNLELESDAGLVALDLVEAGVHHLLEIDASNGKATIKAIKDDQPLALFENANGESVDTITADTQLRGSDSVVIKYANVDDTLTLWIDGDVVEFSPSSRIVRSDVLDLESHRPHYSVQDQADAAPIGIAFANGMKGKVTRAKVMRDIYYTAVSSASSRPSDGLSEEMNDYQSFRRDLMRTLSEESQKEYRSTLPGGITNRQLQQEYGEALLLRDQFFSSPELW